MNDGIERVVVSVRDVGKNTKELIYKHKRENPNPFLLKLNELKEKLGDNKFSIPFKRKKKEGNTSIVTNTTFSKKEKNDYTYSEGSLFPKEIINREMIDSSQIKDVLNLNLVNNTSNLNLSYNWKNEEEYDPEYPNDYEMIISEIKQIKKEKRKKENLIKKEKKSNTNKSKKKDKVLKMLQKMGWKGQGKIYINYFKGLGKYEQGIITPLIAKRTSEKYGIIINANAKTEENKINIKNFYNRSPTRILMITNMLNPEEINDEVYTEIRLECELIGDVKDLKFFVFGQSEVELPLGEIVRVFIEFEE